MSGETPSPPESAVLTNKDIARDIKKNYRVYEFPISQRSKDKNPKDPRSLKNEFQNGETVAILKPLPRIVERLQKFQRDHWVPHQSYEETLTRTIESDFEYLSRTRDLEVNTERTRALEELARKMVNSLRVQKGETIQDNEENLVRVVIMRKGENPAFVTPDGTMFIAQSMLNRLDSLDEIASVIGHEIMHLVNNSSYKIGEQKRKQDEFGVQWIHEAACDLGAIPLMESLGMNSMAFSTAIKKLAGYARGVYHQGGLVRSVQNIAAHGLRDSDTSHYDEIPIPQILKQQTTNTNLEILNSKLDEIPAAEIKKALEMLHPRDLAQVYKTLTEQRNSSYTPEGHAKYMAANELLTERLLHAGFSQEDISYLLISLMSSGQSSQADCFIFTSPQIVEEFAKGADKYVDVRELGQMTDAVFGENTDVRLNSPHMVLLSFLSAYLYDVNIHPQSDGMPVTKDSLLNTLQTLSREEFSKSHSAAYGQMTHVIVSYIKEAYSTGKDGILVFDEQKIREFLQEVKDRGINFSSYNFIQAYTVAKSDKHHPEFLKVLKIYSEIFQVDLDYGFDLKEIDDFITQYESGYSERASVKKLEEILDKVNRVFDQEDDITRAEAQRLAVLEYFDKKISGLSDITSRDLLAHLENGTYKYVSEENMSQNDAIARLHLKMLVAANLFIEDNNTFYDYIERVMTEANLDLKNFSRIQLINICEVLIKPRTSHSGKFNIFTRSSANLIENRYATTSFKNYERFMKLPFIQAILEKEPSLNYSSIEELNTYMSELLGKIQYYGFSNNMEFSIYDDTLLSLVIGRSVAKNFESILSAGISLENFDDLYGFISKYYANSVQKGDFLRSINKLYLNSDQIDFDKKIDYLIQYFDQVGIEGMIILGEQIEDIDTYRIFEGRLGEERIKKYLDGGGIVTMLAFGDLLSAQVTQHFDKLLATTLDSDEARRTVSTDLAKVWFDEVLRDIKFFPQTSPIERARGRFVVGEYSRSVFKSIRDSFISLKNLSYLKRFALAQKALVEQNGALTRPENREALAKNLIEGLGLKQGFISTALSTAITEGDEEIIGFPASNMLAGIMFRALDINAINYDLVREHNTYIGDGINRFARYESVSKTLEGSEVERITASPTRDIIVFGSSYYDPFSPEGVALSGESDHLFESTNARLSDLLTLPEVEAKDENMSPESGIDSSTEAVIKGVEASGALGIRALQLASQFMQFSPEVDRRLSETFDSNPGMKEKVRFWYNLNLAAQKDGLVEEFMKNIRLGKFLGGGSLQTTFAAVYKDPQTGADKDVIVKLKNPSVKGFLRKSYDTAKKVLDKVAERKDVPNAKASALTSRMMIDLAFSWCMADLNDKSFIEDDTLFRESVAKFNQQTGADQFYVPELIFTQSFTDERGDIQQKLKSEDLAPRITVNQFLKDDSVDPALKQEVVTQLGKFLLYQMRGNSFIDENGESYRLIHSDPHIGNYMVDISTGKPRIGVIDRSMYLKVPEKDAILLNKLLSKGGENDFVWSFVNRIMDQNKVRGLNRLRIQSSVIYKVAMEYRSQVSKGETNKFALLRTMLQELSKQNLGSSTSPNSMDVKLYLRLMIRNIAAMRELGRRHGIDIASLFSTNGY